MPVRAALVLVAVVLLSAYAPVTSVNKLSATKAEVTVQLQFSPAGGAKAPPGGFYLLAADVSGAAAGKTTVALYGAVSGPYSETYKVTKAWAQGSNPDCPRLVGS